MYIKNGPMTCAVQADNKCTCKRIPAEHPEIIVLLRVKTCW